MSIKITNGIPIASPSLSTNDGVFIEHHSVTASADEHGLNLEVTDISAVLAAVPQDHDSLFFPFFKQQRTLWCWAACAHMVLHKAGQHMSQCKVASALIDEDCCADGCGKTCCNNECDKEDVEAVYDSFGLSAHMHEGEVPFYAIKAEISQAKRPVEIGIKWEGDNGGHLLLVFGWSRENGVRRIKIKDPLYGEAEIKYSDLAHYHGGRWILTWTGIG